MVCRFTQLVSFDIEKFATGFSETYIGVTVPNVVAQGFVASILA